MNWAARINHIEIVKWLHFNRSEGCTKQALKWAKLYHHREVVQWLNENKPILNS